MAVSWALQNAGGSSGLCEERWKEERMGCPSLRPLVFFYLAWHPPACSGLGALPWAALAPQLKTRPEGAVLPLP